MHRLIRSNKFVFLPRVKSLVCQKKTLKIFKKKIIKFRLPLIIFLYLHPTSKFAKQASCINKTITKSAIMIPQSIHPIKFKDFVFKFPTQLFWNSFKAHFRWHEREMKIPLKAFRNNLIPTTAKRYICSIQKMLR